MNLFPKLKLHKQSIRHFKVPFTSDRYNIKKLNFETLNLNHLKYFSDIIDNPNVNLIYADGKETKLSDLNKYNIDYLNSVRGQSKLILKPKCTDQISKILKYANYNNLPIVPISGNTGLVGGSNPVFDEIVLSLERLNKIENIDNISGIVTVQSGVILEQLQNVLSQNDPPLLVPLDLGSKGSCLFGGNVATNAGGLRVLRYGNLHGSILGLEVVLADGRILNLESNVRKDNTGYDIKQLFIGSEGTLGIITKVNVLCPNLPKNHNVALFRVKSFDQVLEIFSLAKQNLSEILSAFEFFDNVSQQAAKENLGLTNPIATDGSVFYILVETQGSNEDHDQEKLENFIQLLSENEHIDDGILAFDQKQIDNIWSLREKINEAIARDGYVYKYDVSLPLEILYKSVEDLKMRIEECENEGVKHNIKRLNGYGHVGDGNIHINVSAVDYDKKTSEILEPWIYEYVGDKNGSISAEHGIGFKKTQYLGLSKSDTAIDIMKDLKAVFDPKGILNPYKVLR